MAVKTAWHMRITRHERVRSKVQGTRQRPRLAVYRSLNHIYAQIIDDESGETLVSASTLEPARKERVAKVKKSEVAKEIGTLIARRAAEKGITQVVFDRGGFLYHGRVKALAGAAREGGLKF